MHHFCYQNKHALFICQLLQQSSFAFEFGVYGHITEQLYFKLLEKVRLF